MIAVDFSQNEKELEELLLILNGNLKKYQKSNDKMGEASQLAKIGDVLMKLNRNSEALEALDHAITIFLDHNDTVELARTYALKGSVLYNLKNYNQSIDFYHNAIQLIENNDYLKPQIIEYINYYNQIGNVYEAMGNYETALKFYEDAIERHKQADAKSTNTDTMIFLRVGNIGVADSLVHIGALFERQERYDDAIKNYTAALEIYEGLDDERRIAQVNQTLGLIYLSLNKISEAFERLKKAGDIHNQIGDNKNFATDLELMSDIIYQDYPEQAIQLLEKSLKIHEELADRQKQADVLRKLGLIHSFMDDLDKALENHNKALDIFIELKIDLKQAQQFRSIGEVMSELDSNTEALEYYNKALVMFQKYDNALERAGTLMNIGILMNKMNDYEQALQNLNQSLEIALDSDSKDLQAVVLSNLTMVHNNLGDKKQAIECIEKAISIADSIQMVNLIDELKNIKDELSI